MAKKLLFPSAIDYVRIINSNIVDNLLGGRTSYLKLPTIYQLAYAVVHETGELPIEDDILAPDESINKNNQVNIVSGKR